MNEIKFLREGSKVGFINGQSVKRRVKESGKDPHREKVDVQ